MSSSAKRRLRTKERKEHERKRAKGEGEVVEPKIYRVWYYFRDAFFENNKTLDRLDVLQVRLLRLAFICVRVLIQTRSRVFRCLVRV